VQLPSLVTQSLRETAALRIIRPAEREGVDSTISNLKLHYQLENHIHIAFVFMDRILMRDKDS
jgi:hypothetical protein